MVAAKWMDCEWRAYPPSTAIEARILDPHDGSVKETVFVVNKNFVNFTGFRLSFEKQYIITVQNASMHIRLASKLRYNHLFDRFEITVFSSSVMLPKVDIFNCTQLLNG